MKYLVIEEFPDGEYNIPFLTEEYQAVFVNETQAKQFANSLQKAYVVPLSEPDKVLTIKSIIHTIYETIYRDLYQVDVATAFESRLQEYVDVRHIVRGICLEVFPTLTGGKLAEIESELSKLAPVDHSTISHSKGRYYSKYKNSEKYMHKLIINKVKKFL